MNILILTSHLNPGGISRYVVDLSLGLKSQGCKVLVGSSAGQWAEQLSEAGVGFVEIPIKTKFLFSFKVFLSLFKLIPICRENKIDIIHANTRVTQSLACMLSRILSVKYISTFHGFHKGKLFRTWLKFSGDMTTVPSQEVKKHLINDFCFKESKIKVVYNGIDLSSHKREHNSDDARRIMGINNGPTIGIAARFSQEKNHALIIEAFSILINDFPDAQLLFFGKGRLEEFLKNRVLEKKLTNKVLFIKDADLSVFLDSLDIFLLVSSYEGFGLSLIEAQAHKVPAIGSPVGGIKEIIDNNSTGLLLDKITKYDLFEKMKYLLKNPQFRQQLAERAYWKLKDKFVLSKTVEKTLEVYEQVLASKTTA